MGKKPMQQYDLVPTPSELSSLEPHLLEFVLFVVFLVFLFFFPQPRQISFSFAWESLTHDYLVRILGASIVCPTTAVSQTKVPSAVTSFLAVRYIHKHTWLQMAIWTCIRFYIRCYSYTH